MSILAVTFGNGFFQPVAKSFARRFSSLNGIEALAIDPLDAPPLTDPSWIKAWVWDLVPESVERIIWFDADCVPIAPILDLLSIYDYPFGAVQDVESSVTAALRQCPDAKMCRFYINAGVFFAHRGMRPLFEEWKSLMSEDMGFRDQTSLNLVLNRYYQETDICFLPRVVNWMDGFGKAPKSVRMMHLAGWPDQNRRIQILRAFCRVFDPEVKALPKEGESC